MQLILRRKGSALTKDLLTNKLFLNAINNRLLSFSNNIKALGVVLVDYVCELNGEKDILIGSRSRYIFFVDGTKCGYHRITSPRLLGGIKA